MSLAVVCYYLENTLAAPDILRQPQLERVRSRRPARERVLLGHVGEHGEDGAVKAALRGILQYKNNQGCHFVTD